MTLLGVLVFVFGVLGSVMLHEAGHFVTARRYGMKATQFFVGFGPTLWSRTKGETEYGVKGIPVGGFVKIVGMTPLEEVEPGDEGRAFYRQPAKRKVVVLSAGSTVHFMLCIVLVAAVVTMFGIQKQKPGAQLFGINACVAKDLSNDCKAAGAVAGPASKAGLRNGDVITAVDGTAVKDSKSLIDRIRADAGQPVELTVRRGGRTSDFTLTPVPVVLPKTTKAVGAVGAQIGDYFTQQHLGPVGIVKETGHTIGEMVTGTFDTLTKKISSISQVYGPHRDPNGFVGLVGAGGISGQIAASHISTSDKVADLLLLLASLNLFIGVFNLLPLLPLDGGHIAVVLFEQARDRVRRARGYVGDLQRVDMNKLMPLTFAVVVLFASLTLFLVGADIVNPITLR